MRSVHVTCASQKKKKKKKKGLAAVDPSLVRTYLPASNKNTGITKVLRLTKDSDSPQQLAKQKVYRTSAGVGRWTSDVN